MKNKFEKIIGIFSGAHLMDLKVVFIIENVFRMNKTCEMKLFIFFACHRMK